MLGAVVPLGARGSKMKLAVGNSWVDVEEISPEELEWLDAYTSCKQESMQRQDGRWVRLESIYSAIVSTPSQTIRFPTGLLYGPFLSSARANGIIVDRRDVRTMPCEPFPVDHRDRILGWLRPYQREAIESVIARRCRGILKAPTAAGKSSLFFALTQVYPCEWLFLVHRADIAAQIAERYAERTHDRVGVFEGGEWHRGNANVTVATFQSISRALRRDAGKTHGKFLQHIDAVNIDEVHALSGPTYVTVVQALEHAYYRIGQSGTPFERDDVATLHTVGAVGPTLYEISTQKLIELGYASKPTIVMRKFVHEMREGEVPSDHWASFYKRKIVHNHARNALLATIALDASKPALLFVEALDHAKFLVESLSRKGLRAESAMGNNDTAIRQEKIKRLTSGKIDVLICTVIFQEGVDIPELEAVIVGGAKSSPIGVIQRAGRGMRITKTKNTFEVWDILDVPDSEDRQWLKKHAAARLAAYESEGHDVRID